MRDQPLIKPTRVRIPTVLKDEWTEMAACAGKTPTVEMCKGSPCIVACELLYRELIETLEDPDTLTGVWAGKERGRAPSKHDRYDPPPKPTECSVEGCEYTFNLKHVRNGMCQYHHRNRNA